MSYPIAFFVASAPAEFPQSVQELMNTIADSLGTEFGAGVDTSHLILGQLGGGQAPTSNIGPWANGSEWWFWEPSLGTYQRGTDGVPIGMVMIWGAPSVPTNWLLCDGSAVSRTQYSLLFQAIGTSWGGGDGSTTFNLPPPAVIYMNGIEFVPDPNVPLDPNTLALSGIGTIGGGQTMTIAAANMPPLQIKIPFVLQNKKYPGGYPLNLLEPTQAQGNQTFTYPLADQNGASISDLTANGSAPTTPSIMSPFLAANYIIKYQ